PRPPRGRTGPGEVRPRRARGRARPGRAAPARPRRPGARLRRAGAGEGRGRAGPLTARAPAPSAVLIGPPVDMMSASERAKPAPDARYPEVIRDGHPFPAGRRAAAGAGRNALARGDAAARPLP